MSTAKLNIMKIMLRNRKYRQSLQPAILYAGALPANVHPAGISTDSLPQMLRAEMGGRLAIGTKIIANDDGNGGYVITRPAGGRWYKTARNMNADFAKAVVKDGNYVGVVVKGASETAEHLVSAQAGPKIDREARRQGLRMLMGLNNQREGGPVDGVQFEEEQRAQW